MRFNVSGQVVVPQGVPLAKVNPESGELWVWPQGIGQGMCLTMLIGEWSALNASAEAAINAHRLHLERYTATEGNGDAL